MSQRCHNRVATATEYLVVRGELVVYARMYMYV